MIIFMETFAKRLKEIMTEQNLSPKELATQIDVNASTISNWLSEKTTPNISCLPKLNKALHIRTNYLLGLDNKKR